MVPTESDKSEFLHTVTLFNELGNRGVDATT
jgi:hypothetical protein